MIFYATLYYTGLGHVIETDGKRYSQTLKVAV